MINYICSKCGKTDVEHDYWKNITSNSHVIFKWTEERSKKQAQRLKRNRLNSPGRSILLICTKYKGCCSESNYCFGLDKGPGRNDFGYGECIYLRNALVAYWDIKKETWKVDSKKLKNWLKQNKLKGIF